MSEDTTKDLTKEQKTDSTNPLAFEELVKRQFEAIFKRLDQADEERRQEMAQLRSEIQAIGVRLERVENRLGRVENKLDDIDKRVKKLDRKVGPFIEEQIDLKYELEELKESLRPQNGSTVNTV